MVTPTQGMSSSQCYTGTTYKAAVPVEIKAMSSTRGATWKRSPAAKPCYAHAEANSQWGRAALGGSKPSLLTPNPSTLGLERPWTSFSDYFSVSQPLLKSILWGAVVTLQYVKYTVTPSLVNPGLLYALDSYMAHIKPFLKDPGGAAGFPGRERSAPAGLRHCPAPCTRTRTGELIQTLGLHLLQSCNSPSSELA